MKLKQREIVLLTVLFLLLTATAVYLYLWQPLLAEQAALRSEIAGLTESVHRLEPWETKTAELTARIERIKAEILSVQEQRELGIPLPEFLVMLEEAAVATFIRLETTSIAVADIGAITTLQLAGTYHDIYRFLTLLEEQEQALLLQTLQFSGGGDELQGTLEVRLFSGAVIGEPKVGGFPARSPFVPRRP